MKLYKPIEIARKLKISTSALRHYESWGIVPPAARADNGYRMYTEEHLAYFTCIRAMLPGFGMNIAKEVMKLMMRGEVAEALWVVNASQAELYQDKVMAERTVELLDTNHLTEAEQHHPRSRRWMTIGEIAEETGVPASAIRHWELEGLLDLPRDEENGYRKFNQAHYRQILIIRTLRSANHPLDVIKSVMDNLDHHDIAQARQIARESMIYLDHINRHQIRGIHSLYELCKVLGL